MFHEHGLIKRDKHTLEIKQKKSNCFVKMLSNFVFFLFVIITIVGRQTVLGVSCRIPQQCRRVFDNGVEATAGSIPDFFSYTICSEQCVKPLYNHLREHDPLNATLLNLYCATSSHNDHCLVLASGVPEAYYYSCFLVTQQDSVCPTACTPEMRSMYDDYDCCLYSFHLLYFGRSSTEHLFDICLDEEAGVCTGGATGELIGEENESTEICSNDEEEEEETTNNEVTENEQTNNEVTDNEEPTETTQQQECASVRLKFKRSVLLLCSQLDTSQRCSSECILALVKGGETLGCCLFNLWETYSGSDYTLEELCCVEMPKKCTKQNTTTSIAISVSSSESDSNNCGSLYTSSPSLSKSSGAAPEQVVFCTVTYYLLVIIGLLIY